MSLSIRHINYYIHPKKVALHLQELEEGIERIEILTKGRAWILHEGRDVEVKRGDILWHREGESPIYKSDPDDLYECLNIVCHVEEKELRKRERVNQWFDLEDLDKFCHQAKKDFKESVIPFQLFNSHALTVIEYQIQKSNASDKKSRLPKALKVALGIIERDFLKGLGIKELASHVGLSVTHLHELFRKHLSLTPHQHILRLRISQACQLLSSTTDPLKVIADRTGFKSANSFCRSFKHYKRMTPDQFRKKYS